MIKGASKSIKVIKRANEEKKVKVRVKPRKLVINISCCRYPVVKKVAKHEFNLFLSARDMFAPVNG